MFVHQTKLEHVLPASDYHSAEAFEREQESLFRQQWQIIGLSDAVAKPGGYLAAELSGLPVIVHNQDGVISGFRNACAHRHAQLRPNGCGNQERLTCQYHGWQYNAEGRVAKIPDGGSFKGIKAEQFCLGKIRTEVLGPFVFATLAPSGPSMREFLGEFASEFDQYFGAHRLFSQWETAHPVNWKIVCENAVESYHVPLVHPNTFANYRDQSLHDHRLADSHTRYADLQPWDQSIVSKGFRTLASLLLKHPNYERFKHTHLYPNHLLYYGELMSTWTIVEPLGPKSSRYQLFAFVPKDVRYGIAGRCAQDLSSGLLLRQLKRILGEDMGIWPAIQRGLEASDNPGILSCREERIWAFQRFIADQAGQPSEQPVEPSDTTAVSTLG